MSYAYSGGLGEHSHAMLPRGGASVGALSDEDFAINTTANNNAGNANTDDMDWIQYDDFDYDRVADTHAIDAENAREHEGAPMPPGRSWVLWNVTIPNRLALLTLISIGVYEVLVAVSMGVKGVRSLMVNGLMHFLLALNVFFLLSLTALVIKARLGITFEFITSKLQGNKRIQEDTEAE